MKIVGRSYFSFIYLVALVFANVSPESNQAVQFVNESENNFHPSLPYEVSPFATNNSLLHSENKLGKQFEFYLNYLTLIMGFSHIINLIFKGIGDSNHQGESSHHEGALIHNNSHEGNSSHEGGVHIVIADFPRVKISFIIGLWIFCSSLAKIGWLLM